MSDWDFLHEMRERGYSDEDIADAAGVGYAPWHAASVGKEWVDAQFEDELPEDVTTLESVEPFRSREGLPFSILEQIGILEDLVNCARRHYANTGRYLQVWGELGEIYAEVKFGLRRHATHTPGSDGTIDGKRVEVKTISPEKTNDRVDVRRQGDFEQLLIVRIDQDFRFTGKLIDREKLADGGGKFLRMRMQQREDSVD